MVDNRRLSASLGVAEHPKDPTVSHRTCFIPSAGGCIVLSNVQCSIWDQYNNHFFLLSFVLCVAYVLSPLLLALKSRCARTVVRQRRRRGKRGPWTLDLVQSAAAVLSSFHTLSLWLGWWFSVRIEHRIALSITLSFSLVPPYDVATRAKSRVRCRESSTGPADAPYCEAILYFLSIFFPLSLSSFFSPSFREQKHEDDDDQLQRFSLLQIFPALDRRA